MNFLNIYKHKIIVTCAVILTVTLPVFELHATTTEREERVRFSSTISVPTISLLGVSATTTNEGNSPHSRYIDINLPYTNIFTNIHGTTTITASTTYSPYTGHISNHGSLQVYSTSSIASGGSTSSTTSTIATTTSTTATTTSSTATSTTATSTTPNNNGTITISNGGGMTTQTIGGTTSNGGAFSQGSISGGGSGGGSGFTVMNLGSTTTSPVTSGGNLGEVLGASTVNEDLFGTGGGDPEFVDDILGLPNTGLSGNVIYMYLLILSLITLVLSGLLLRTVTRKPETLFLNL